MSAKEKGRFEEMAEKDKGRYEREMANFDKTGAGKGAKGGKRKRTKDPNAPKRALLVDAYRCIIVSIIKLLYLLSIYCILLCFDVPDYFTL